MAKYQILYQRTVRSGTRRWGKEIVEAENDEEARVKFRQFKRRQKKEVPFQQCSDFFLRHVDPNGKTVLIDANENAD